jgi:hypothetical protein
LAPGLSVCTQVSIPGRCRTQVVVPPPGSSMRSVTSMTEPQVSQV